MFTPTTNLVVEEIAAKIDVRDKRASTCSGVKISLAFEEEAPQTVTSIAEVNLPTAAITLAQHSAAIAVAPPNLPNINIEESPSKKQMATVCTTVSMMQYPHLILS